MALTTRCPQCGTSFKVVPDQLRVRNGLVRCGACATVFDGRACLLPEPGAPVTTPPASIATPVVPTVTAQSAPVLATPVAAESSVPVPAAPMPVAPVVPPPAAPVAPMPAAPVIPAPPLSRPAAPPRETPPWEDEPVAAPVPPLRYESAAAPVSAPAAPASPPAVLRGRDAIRQRHASESDLPEDVDGDDDENDSNAMQDDPGYRAIPARHEPVFAPRVQEPYAKEPYAKEPYAKDPYAGDALEDDNEPVIDWDARRRHREDPDSASDRDDRHGIYSQDDHDNRRNRDDRDDIDDHDDRHDPDDDRGHHLRIDHYDDRQDADDDTPGDVREPVLGDTRTRYSSATDVGRAPPEFLDQDRQERRGLFRKVWGYACLIGLIALGLQLVFVYRTDIANSVPVLRPVLETVCKPLDCTVGYARRLERIAISSSSLQPPTGAAAIDDGRSRLVLNLVLRNRYDKPQHWPALVLDLTDLSDTVVVRKVLMPENYLTPEQLRGPFGPAGELKISVPIEVTGVQVNGYQLDKFFP